MKILMHLFPIVFAILPIIARADFIKEFDFHYEESDFDIDRHENVVRITPNGALWSINLESDTEPALPILIYEIAYLGGSDFYDVELCVDPSDRILIAENVEIGTMYPLCSSTYHPKDDWNKFDIEGYYPREQVSVDEYCGIWGFWIRPIGYDPETKSVYLTKDFHIKIRITRKSTSAPNTSSITGISGTDENVNSGSVNPLLVGIPSEVNPDLDIHPDMCEGIDYMIITSKKLEKVFEPLLKWKNQKGLKVKLMTVEHIDSNYTAPTQQERIKKCIREYYLGRLNYVLLGGGVNVVPSPMCYGKVPITNDTIIPTDLYYACLEGQFDWDANGNGIYGEPEDNCELKPSLAVTRLPLDSESEISSFITKLLNYEKNGTVIPKVLLTGAEFFGKYEVGEGSNKRIMSDAEINGEYIYNNGIKPYWDGTVEWKFDTSGSGYTLSAPFIAQQIAKGYAFMDVQAHGDSAGWIFPNDKYFNKQVAPPRIKNKAYTIITTNACHVNAFDKCGSATNPCLSQYLIGDSINGIVGFYGNAREGLGFESTKPGMSQRYEMAFYGKLFNEPDKNKSFGKIAALSKKGTVVSAKTSNLHRWLQYGINAIGDPEMPIYVKEPATFDTVPITVKDYGALTKIEVGTPDCTICVTGKRKSKDFMTVSRRGSAITINGGIPDDPVLVITKQNYKPLIVEGKENIVALGKTIKQISDPRLISASLTEVKVEMEVYNGCQAEITLHDTMGNLRLRHRCQSDDIIHEINTKGLESGIFIMTVWVNGQPLHSHKFVK